MTTSPFVARVPVGTRRRANQVVIGEALASLHLFERRKKTLILTQFLKLLFLHQPSDCGREQFGFSRDHLAQFGDLGDELK
jgi:hypothetical protein